MMARLFLNTVLLFILSSGVNAQCDRWQQRVKYVMDIEFDAQSHRYEGSQEALYINNSPDTLTTLFYHLYFNAFQPGSMMDVRSRTIVDPDDRVKDRISKLDASEIGFIRVLKLKQGSEMATFEENGTVLEVTLPKPIAPGDASIFEMEWLAQVPNQIRRNGRYNKEGIAYSMAQWYPKIANYDEQGWHANPYIGREFYGIWGDFDVTIEMPDSFVIGATGILDTSFIEDNRLTQRYIAENVHDFVWAADPSYEITMAMADDGTQMEFYYQENEETQNWTSLPTIMARAFEIIGQRFGRYPYPVYKFMQGGDGGMEYPMATLITGHRSLGSLVGVSVHELMHSWYQMMMGSNESLYPWMDEGFTSYASSWVMNELAKEGLVGDVKDNPYESTYTGYRNLVNSGIEEPLSTHADHFVTNTAYGLGSYVKGAVFMHQLGYIIGRDYLDKTLLEYYNECRFKHPNPNDLIRTAEKVSGCELDWYKEYWVYSTKSIDYSVDSVWSKASGSTMIEFSKNREMPMPIDFDVEMGNGDIHHYTIPLSMMRWSKHNDGSTEYSRLPDWRWVDSNYTAEIDIPFEDIKSITIDPRKALADMILSNNSYQTEDK